MKESSTHPAQYLEDQSNGILESPFEEEFLMAKSPSGGRGRTEIVGMNTLLSTMKKRQLNLRNELLHHLFLF
jgi:hypothetical protein